MRPTAASLAELQNKANFDHVIISVPHEEEEPLNCDMAEVNKGVVMFARIQQGSALIGHVQANDYCLSVNGQPVGNKEAFFNMALKADPQLELVIARPKQTTQIVKKEESSSPPPQEVAQASVPKVPTPKSSSTPTAGKKSKRKKTKKGKKGVKKAKKEKSAKKSAKGAVEKSTGAAVEKSGKSAADKSGRDKSGKDKSGKDKSGRAAAEKVATSTPALVTDPKLLAQEKGIQLNPEKEYLLLTIATSGTGKPLGLGIMYLSKVNSVIVSTVQPNATATGIFMQGDRLLAIDDTMVTDAAICKQLITQSKGDFKALVERPPNGISAYSLEKRPTAPPLKSSYTTPDPNNPEHRLGDPMIGYETAPADVQTFITKQLPILMRAYGVGSQMSVKADAKKERLKIEHDVHEQQIESDVAQGAVLKKVPR